MDISAPDKTFKTVGAGLCRLPNRVCFSVYWEGKVWQKLIWIHWSAWRTAVYLDYFVPAFKCWLSAHPWSRWILKTYFFPSCSWWQKEI